MKTYKVTWLDNVGEAHILNVQSTKKPKDLLFNECCKSIVRFGGYFVKFEDDNIKKCIRQAKPHHGIQREAYFIFAEDKDGNQQVLECREVV